jgi:hypothetical protein
MVEASKIPASCGAVGLVGLIQSKTRLKRRFYLLVRFFDPPFEKSCVPSETKF